VTLRCSIELLQSSTFTPRFRSSARSFAFGFSAGPFAFRRVCVAEFTRALVACPWKTMLAFLSSTVLQAVSAHYAERLWGKD